MADAAQRGGAGRLVHGLAMVLALAGGLVLALITIMTVLSISGRALIFAGLGPVPGDYELVEAGSAFAVFAFLPWCHLTRAHASVEIVTQAFGTRINRIIDIVVDLLMLAVASVLAWQHWLGTLDKLAYGETTFILRFPLWWAYAAGLVGAVAFVIVAIYCLVRSIAAFNDPEKPEDTATIASGGAHL